MTTTKAVISYINANYTDYQLAGWMIPKIAAETDTSQGTVYRAIRQLRAMGAMDGKTFTRRQLVTIEDLQPYFRNEMLLITTDKAAQIAAETISTLPAIYAALRWAEMCRYIEQRNGGSYGLLYVLRERRGNEA